MEQAKKLLRWYDQNKRPLPWRDTKDPYAIWISEIMLQQTQVETVVPFYKRFLKVFPTVRHLAEAPLEEALKLWSGLGYYSRARNLHLAAQMIVKGYQARFPKTKREWLLLPGIGEYTSGAIASIAFEEKVPIVDGNVIRVLARVFALKGDPKKNPLRKKLWKLAATLLPMSRVGDFNQALMELGAKVCLPQNPLCDRCPWQKHCVALQRKKVDQYPSVQRKMEIQRVDLDVFIVCKKNKFLLAQRNNQKHLQSMWEFPQILPKGFAVKKMGEASKIYHSIMNRRYKVKPILYKWLQGKPIKNGHYVNYRWICLEELKEYPTSSLNQKISKLFKPCFL